MNNKRKILIDGAIFGLQKSGGISRVFAEILLGLNENPDYEVIFLLPKNKNIDWMAISGRLKNIRVVKRGKILTWTALRFRPDIWHSSYYVGFPWAFSGIKVITFHDMIEELVQKKSSKDSLNKFLALQKSDRIFAISDHSAQDLEKFWPQFSQKTVVVKNGLSLETYAKKRVEEPYLIYVGRRKGYKNFLYCVKEILKDVRFAHMMIYVVGGEESMETEFLDLERIRWFKTLSYDDVQKLIQNSQALLFPSLYEGFGLPIVEAFHHGVPVLAFRTSCIPEVTGEEYPLADLTIKNSLGDTLAKLLQERSKWIEYGHARRALFTRENMMKALVEQYEAF